MISVDRNELILDRDHVLEEEDIETIINSEAPFVTIHREDINAGEYQIIYNTLKKDVSNSEKEALEEIYRQLRITEAPDEQTAREIIQNLFFAFIYNIIMIPIAVSGSIVPSMAALAMALSSLSVVLNSSRKL